MSNLVPVRLVLQADRPFIGQALLFLRGMVGVGLGGAHVPVALYLEFVPTKLRGVMLVALQSFWTVGTMIEVPLMAPTSSLEFMGSHRMHPEQWKSILPMYSYATNRAVQRGCYTMSQTVLMVIKNAIDKKRLPKALLGWAVLSTMGWRWLLGISSIPLLGLLLLYPVLPESPYFLAAVGQTQQAQEVLATVARVNKKAMPPGSLKRAAAVVSSSEHLLLPLH